MDIVVASCAAYSDAWVPFVGLFRKFWPDCPYRLCLVTDRLAEPWAGDVAIEIGQDLGWGPNLVAGLRKLGGSPHVLLMQEDFFLSAPVRTDVVARALAVMRESNHNACFRLFPCPGPDMALNDWYGLVKHDAPYRVSCQSAIWLRSELEFMAHEMPTAAHFEIEGTCKSAKRCGCLRFFSTLRTESSLWPLQYYCSAITRGQWEPDAVAFARAQGVSVDTSRRPLRAVQGSAKETP